VPVSDDHEPPGDERESATRDDSGSPSTWIEYPGQPPSSRPRRGWSFGQTGPQLYPGDPVDHFEVIRLIGRGGMGEVYLARDTQLGRRVALKLLHPKRRGEDAAAERFEFEARTTARFSHPHIVTIHAVGYHGESPYVALEFLEGETLKERLRETSTGPREAVRIGHAIADALQEAHRHGVLHRDLKPGNVMIPQDGRLRVVDFGLAKVVQPMDAQNGPLAPLDGLPDDLDVFHSHDDHIRGTPSHMAPEQWTGHPIGPAADVWALGVILFQMLDGDHPYEGVPYRDLGPRVASEEPAPALDEDVEPDLCSLVERCLRKDPDARPTATEVLQTLESLLTGGRRGRGREPFLGLLPCDERDADWFFGRDAEIDAFLERRRTEPILPVVGPSGAGKSSFVAAGVIPRLREEGPWTVLRMRPGRRPLRALVACLLRGDATRASRNGGASADSRSRSQTTGPHPDTLESMEASLLLDLREAPGRLSLRLVDLAGLDQSRVLLFVDQLEELYTLVEDPEQRRLFMQALCSAADDPEGPVRVVFTLRDDFLGRVAETAAAREVLGRVTVLRSPGPAALEEILVCSAASVDYAFDDPGLVDGMVKDVHGEVAALPLLQVTGQMLWQRRDQGRRHLRRADYDAMGGVAGALAHHADDVLAGLSGDQIGVVRGLMLRLVTSEGTRRIMPRGELIEGMGVDAGAMLDRLVERRLLLARKSRSGGSDAEMELVYESLIRSWSRLARWLEESREERGFIEDASQAAALWARRGRPAPELWTGDALRIALTRLDQVASVPERVREFLHAARAREEARRIRRRNGLVALFAALVGLAILFGALAYEASRQRSVSEQRQAEVLLEGARAAVLREDQLQARALFRESFEASDSLAARMTWLNIADDPELWSADFRSRVHDVAFSPDGCRLAAVVGNLGPVVIDASSGAARLIETTGGSHRAVEFLPSAEAVVLGSMDRVELLDLQDGSVRELAATRTHGSVNDVSVSPDGLEVAWSNEMAKGFEITRLADGASLAIEPFPRDSHAYPRIEYTADGRYLAFTAGTQTTTAIRIWDRDAGELLDSIPASAGTQVRALAFGPEGRLLAWADDEADVHVWDLETASPLHRLRGHAGDVFAIAFSTDGALLASGGADGSVRVWDRRSGRELTTVAIDFNITAMRFHPQLPQLAVASDNGTVRLWSIPALLAHKPPRGSAHKINALAAMPGGEAVVAVGQGGAIRLWDTRTGRELEAFEGPKGIVYNVDVTADGRQLVTSGHKEPVVQWDIATQRMVRVYSLVPFPLFNAHLGPDGRWLSFGENDRVQLWDLDTGSKVADIHHPDVPFSQHFSPDGTLLATGARDLKVRLFRLPDGQLVRELGDAGTPLSFPSFAPDGRRLIADSWTGDAPFTGVLHLWDLREDTHTVLELPGGRSCSAVFHPDGERIGLQCADGTAHVWNPVTDEVLMLPTGVDVENYGRFVFGPGGAWLWVIPRDETVRLFDTDTGRPLWHAPALLRRPAQVLTHLGWQPMDVAAPAPDATTHRWRTALEQRARYASQSPGGQTLCVHTWDEGVEIWDPTLDDVVARFPSVHARQIAAHDRGCVVLDDASAALLLDRDGAQQLLADGVGAIGVAGDHLLVATDHDVFTLDATGAPQATTSFPMAPVAVTRLGDAAVIGAEDGTLALASDASTGQEPAVTFQPLTHTPVTRIVEGPHRTLIAGYRNGYVGVWDSNDGTLLYEVKLHGPVTHLVRDGTRIHAATEVGDFETLDLAILGRGWCELVREVWEEAPLVWRGGRAVVQEPDPRHVCAP